MIHYDSAISITALITIAGAVIRLVYQTGGMQQAFKELAARVEEGGDKLERYTSEHTLINEEMARREMRLNSLERWRERLETRDKG
jgi:hypothetical protein